MKKFVIILALLLINTTAMANQTLDKIENSLYGYTYSAESDTVRLNRIEESVYGKISTGDVKARIAKLNKDMSANLMGQEIEPKEDTFAQEEDSWVFAKEPTEAAKMDYPVIDELERQVFKKEFKDQNIKLRLTNLEKKTFGKSYETDDLSTRTDRLKAEIRPQRFMANNMEKQDNFFYNDTVGRMDEDYHISPYGAPFDYNSYNNRTIGQNSNSNSSFSPSRQLNLSAIEKTLYKTKFENEPTSTRLSRIESSVFGTTFPNDNEYERISRISSAINAQKSARKYDSNRFNQNMATAVQIGTLILMVLACIL